MPRRQKGMWDYDMSRPDDHGMFWAAPAATYGDKFAMEYLPKPPPSDWAFGDGPDEYPDLSGQGMIAVDVETRDPDIKSRGPGAQRDGYICGIAIGTEKGFRRYYPIRHQGGPNMPAEYVLEWVSQVMSLPVPKVGANLLYDLDYLTMAGVKCVGPYYDVQVAEPLLDETRLSYSLESITQKHLGEGKKEDEINKYFQRYFKDETNVKANLWRMPPNIVGPYAEGDVDLPLRIFSRQKQQLESLGLWELFLMESKLIPMLLAMRQRGVRVDVDRAEALYEDMGKQQTEALDRIESLVGFRVDAWAAASIAKAFDKVGVEYPRTEKTGAPSFRKEWLDQQPHVLAKAVKDIRNYDKLKETFIKGYILNGHTNGRIHCQFNQLRSDAGGTVSGRFSSSYPNLQNIPVRFGKAIRQLFVPEEGQAWWKFDWSQIEYRLVVHYAARLGLAGAGEVVDKYNSDPATDYHAMMAKITGLDRTQAKTLNFGLIYGQGLGLLCSNLGVDFEEGTRIIKEFEANAPFARPLANMASHKARIAGEVRTLLGRRRRFNAWEKDGVVTQEQVPGSRRAFTHKALNAIIQGSAADIMKKAMVQSWESGVYDVLGAPHLTVHDELDGSLPIGDKPSQDALAELKHIMETCVQLEVPLKADGGTGSNWGSVGEELLI